MTLHLTVALLAALALAALAGEDVLARAHDGKAEDQPECCGRPTATFF